MLVTIALVLVPVIFYVTVIATVAIDIMAIVAVNDGDVVGVVLTNVIVVAVIVVAASHMPCLLSMLQMLSMSS